jgi:hypothetical protein
MWVLRPRPSAGRVEPRNRYRQAGLGGGQALPPLANGQAPVLRYFTVLMETAKLNKVESIELARPALQQGKVPLIEKWLGEEKLTCSEALGDMVMALNPKLALAIFLRSGDAHEKVIQTLLATVLLAFGLLATIGNAPSFTQREGEAQRAAQPA